MKRAHLDELLPCEVRKVANGEINLHGNRYYSKGLEEWHGLEVSVAFDPCSAERVWVRDQKGNYIGEAALDGNKGDYFSESFREKANDGRNAAAIRRAQQKTAQKMGIDTKGMSLEAVADAISQGMGGGPIFGGAAPDMGEEQREAIRERLARAAAPLEAPKDKYIRLLRDGAQSGEDVDFMGEFETSDEGRAIKRFHSKHIAKAQ